MEHTEFYSNSIQSVSTTSSQFWYYYSYPTNSTTAANRPYIEYEVSGGVSGYTHKVVGVAAANIGKVNGVATANLGKVVGVD